MAETTNPLTDLSGALAEAVATASASVVTVSARRRFPASGIAWTADGVIVTADHVLEREENIGVTLPEGRTLVATIVGRDPGSDIAVLRVAATALAPIIHGEPARVGALVLAVGRPSEGGPMASLGVVSAIGGAWRTRRGGTIDGYLRSDTTFYPGFSGGPLIDGAGRVVGLNSSRLGRGAGLTVPIAAVSRVVESLLATGRIRRGYLGVGSQVVKLPGALSARLNGQETGLLVVSVEPGSPADTAGIMLGDIMVAIAAVALTDTDDLHACLGAESVGTTITVSLFRNGEARDLSVTIGERA